MIMVMLLCSLDGVIVPEESAEILLDAWETEQQIAMEKDKSVSGWKLYLYLC